MYGTEDWKRLGIQVRKARIAQGHSNRSSLATASGVSERLISDVESGTRSNFSERKLNALSASLGWSSDAVTRILGDKQFQPRVVSAISKKGIPDFDDSPAAVDVEHLQGATDLLISCFPEAATAMEQSLVEALYPVARAYVIRLIEDNCDPGRSVSPAVIHWHDGIVRIGSVLAPEDPEISYLRWLSGEELPVGPGIGAVYQKRWSSSRRSRSKPLMRFEVPS